MLWSSYNGKRKGEALADVLLGNVQPERPPALHLVPEHHPDARHHRLRDPADRDEPRAHVPCTSTGRSRYPFGYGLSYTDVRVLEPARRQDATLDANDTLHASVDVTNTGTVGGHRRSSQLYVTTPDAPAALERPLKRLKGFAKVALAPGQTKTVPLNVDVADLAFFDQAPRALGGRPGPLRHPDRHVERRRRRRSSSASCTVSGAPAPGPDGRDRQAGDGGRRGARRGPARALPPARDGRPAAHRGDERRHALRLHQQGRRASRCRPACTLHYASNRPRVVAVDGLGRIRTVGPGVATVTASVSYAGVDEVDALRRSRCARSSRPSPSAASRLPARSTPSATATTSILLGPRQRRPRWCARGRRGATVAVTQAARGPGHGDGRGHRRRRRAGAPTTVNFAHRRKSDELRRRDPRAAVELGARRTRRPRA